MANRKRRQPDHQQLLGGAMMGDNTVTLSSGRVLTIDLYKITMREWRSMFAAGATQEQGDVICAKALGITADEFIDLPQPDYRLAQKALIDTAVKPLADPNSQSASISG
jgi:hypothetical protein